jgi:hypothetical protein
MRLQAEQNQRCRKAAQQWQSRMPIRRLLEREFHEVGLRLPVHLVETTSAFTTMLPPDQSGVCSHVARFCCRLSHQSRLGDKARTGAFIPG